MDLLVFVVSNGSQILSEQHFGCSKVLLGDFVWPLAGISGGSRVLIYIYKIGTIYTPAMLGAVHSVFRISVCSASRN